MSKNQIKRLVWIALMAALIAIGALTTIPLGPLPFTLQTMFVFLTALILGPKDGLLAVSLYLLLGTIGLPIFAGGKSGLAVILGPTGGWLVGFLFAVAIAGFAQAKSKVGKVQIIKALILTVLIANTVLYSVGILQMKFILDISFIQAFYIAIAFIVPDCLKIAAAIYIWYFLSKRSLLPQVSSSL